MIKKAITFLLLSVVFFAASWSLFRNDFFYVHDFTQGARIVEMRTALSDGHFPVRWSPDLGFGYGMPLFEFYAPLPSYVGAGFYALGFSLVNSVKFLFLISTLVTLIGGYKLGKILFGNAGGLMVSAALTLAPYRAVNLFVRGAISEAWAIMVLPFILYGIIQVVRKTKGGWKTLLFSLVILILSHNLTSMMFLPLSILFGGVYLFLYQKNRKDFQSSFMILAGVYLLAIAMTSFYWLPALMEKGYTRVEKAIVGGYFDYKLHFLYIRQFFEVNWKYGGSSWGPYDDVSFYLGTGQLLAFGLSIFLFVKYFLKKKFAKFDKRLILYLSSLFLLGFSIFMTLGHSQFIWDKIPFFKFIQFPWRWLSLVIIFLSISIGFVSKFIKNKFHRYLFSGFIFFVIVVGNWQFFQPEKYYQDSSEFYYSDKEKIRKEISITLPDYIPIQIKSKVIEPVVGINEMLGCELDRQQQEPCEFKFVKLVNKTQQKLVEVSLPKDTSVEFAVADFPGWTAKVDGNFVDHRVSEFGTILVPLKAGDHKIALEFKDSKVRLWADTASLFALLIFLSVFFWYHEK